MDASSPTTLSLDPPRLRVLVLAAFAVGFSPALYELARHWAAAPWAAYGALFPGLAALAMASERGPGAPSRWGFLAVGLALALELGALGAGVAPLARAALALGAVGVVRALGLGSLPAAALLAFAVPLPARLSGLGSPGLERAWLEIARALPGPSFRVEGSSALAGDHTLTLMHADGGLPLATLLAGLALYASLRWQRPARRVLRMLAWAAVALPVQLVAVVGACWLLALGGPARAALSVAPPLVVAAVALAWIEAIRRREGP